MRNKKWIRRCIELPKAKNRKHKTKVRDMRLAISAPINPPKPAMKAVLADDKDYVTSDLKGRKSLIEKLKTSGLWFRVLSITRNYRKENPDSSYKDLYIHLREHFPAVFDNENVYGSNFKKIVDSDKDWSDCYWSYKGDIEDRIDLQMNLMLNRDNLAESTIVKLYEIQMKKQAEQVVVDDNSNTIVFGFSD